MDSSTENHPKSFGDLNAKVNGILHPSFFSKIGSSPFSFGISEKKTSNGLVELNGSIDKSLDSIKFNFGHEAFDILDKARFYLGYNQNQEVSVRSTVDKPFGMKGSSFRFSLAKISLESKPLSSAKHCLIESLLKSELSFGFSRNANSKADGLEGTGMSLNVSCKNLKEKQFAISSSFVNFHNNWYFGLENVFTTKNNGLSSKFIAYNHDLKTGFGITIPNAENPKNIEFTTANTCKNYQLSAGLIFKDSLVPTGVATVSKKVKNLNFTSQFKSDKNFKTSLRWDFSKQVSFVFGLHQKLGEELLMSKLYSNAAFGLTVKL